MKAQRTAGQGGPQGQRRPTTIASTCTARSSSSSASPSSSATPTTSTESRACWRSCRTTTARSRCSSTARRSTPRAAARSATPARSPTDDRHRRGARHHVRPARPAPPHGADHRRRDRPPGSTGDGDDRRRPPRRDPPQPHRHAPAALRAAQGARRARQAGRLAGRPRPAALRLQPLRRGHRRRRSPRSSSIANSETLRQRAGARLRDHQGRGRRRSARSPSSATSTATSSGCSRPATRSSCAAARTCAPPATSALIKIVSEASIGSNLRRIEAVTGENRVRLLQRDETAGRRRGPTGRLDRPTSCVGGVQRRLDEIKSLHDEIKALRGQLASGRAAELAGAGRRRRRRRPRRRPQPRRPARPGASPCASSPASHTVVLGGVTDTGGVSLVAAVHRRVGQGRRRPDQGRGQGGRRRRRRQGRHRHGRRQEPRGPRRGAAHRRGGGRRGDRPPTVRALGLDLGSKRIGVADRRPHRHDRLAAARCCNAAAASARDHEAIAELVRRGGSRASSWSGCRST